MIWLIQFAAICSIAWMAGSAMGQRCAARPHPRKVILFVFVLLAGWFAFSWWTRQYTDTNKPGWTFAEMWAQTGKWYALLAGLLFGLRFAVALEKQKPPRIFAFLCCFLISFGAWRTMPMYVFVGEGRRDQNGYLRQSRGLQCTCGSVALANYLEQFRHHSRVSEREITKACRTTSEGSTTTDLLLGAAQFGVTNARARRLSWDELLEVKKPVIICVSTLPGVLHATLLVEINENEGILIDPAYGLCATPRQALQKTLRGKTIFFE